MIRIYTVCYFVGIFWIPFCMVKSYCTIFRIITAIFLGVSRGFFFGFFWYQSSSVYRIFLLGHQTMTYHSYRVYHRYIDIPAYQADSPVYLPSPVYRVFLLGHQTMTYHTYRVYHRYIDIPAYQADSPVYLPSPVYTVFLLGYQTTYRVYHSYFTTLLTRLTVRCTYLLLCIQYICWDIRL